MKKTRLILVLALVLVAGRVYGEDFLDDYEEASYSTEKGLVLEVGQLEEVEEGFDNYSQEVRVRVLSGPKKGEELVLINSLSNNQAYDFHLEAGDRVALSIESYQEGAREEIYISDYYRLNYLAWVVLVFIGLLVIIGRGQGLRAVISLGLTLVSIVKILLPNILRGGNPILYSSLVAIGVSIVTILIVTGFNSKSLSAIIGTSLGVLIAGLMAFIVGSKARLTGLSAEDATMLMFIPQGVDFNFQQLLFAGIILGALGAVMDVGMSIASAIEEIYQANPSLTREELFSAGMAVGKDIMGTMANTLILAYVGSSIPILLLFMAHKASFLEIANLDMIASEVVRSLSGSIGLILTIPITALASSILTKKLED